MATRTAVIRRLHRTLAAAGLAALAAGFLPAGSALASPRPAGGGRPVSLLRPAGAGGSRVARPSGLSRGTRDVCGRPARPGFARCLSIARTGLPGHVGLFPLGSVPAGYGPASLQSAYLLPSASAGRGQTVAIVDAYDDPNAATDLAVYRRQYGLPPCTTASGCFRKVAQDGSTNYPAPDPNWAAEISLDLDMVSAICPSCHILLVEASDASLASLGTAVNEAVALGAKYVSNSYGGSEGTAADVASADALYYNHPGVAVTAATGDSGYQGGISYPASSQYVTAVGGTSLTRNTGVARGWTETAWSGGGSGCSAFEAKPAWQHDSGCANRTLADVSAVADPNTGVAVYDTYATFGVNPGWNVFGGTSVASPVIASAIALAGPPARGTYPSSYPYAYRSGLYDITSGSNGTCTPAYLCTAGPGYDGPTGLGTPHGVAAFRYGVHGPHGTLAGTVTDAATGKPLPGAQVSAGGYFATADAAGHYRLAATPGSHDVTATAFGHAAKTATGVPVTAGQTVTENFTLSGVPFETVSGTVTDGSGQHWPLYASVSVPGTPESTYTNPQTGRYQLRLPAGGSYTVQVNPVYPGYQQVRQDVSVGTSNVTQDFAPQVDGAACIAPGYHTVSAMTETFDASTVPAGWSVVDNPGDGSGNTWRFDQPDGIPNLTGGSGNYAAAFHGNNSADPADTSLITPVIDLSADPYPALSFLNAATVSTMNESVDLSLDGGTTWSTVWANSGLASGQVTIPLPQAASKPSVRLRFHMTDVSDVGIGDQEWQVDNVSLTGCAPAPGGLLAGQVRDANTGQGVDGATITSADQPGQSATSVTEPGHPGFYWLFSGLTGSHPFTAAARNYATKTAPVTVAAGHLTQANFTLNAGRLTVTPGSVTATEVLGGHATAQLTLHNTGSAPVTVSFDERPGGFTPLGARQLAGAGGAAPQRIRGHFPLRPGAMRRGDLRPARAPRPSFTDTTPWAPIASTPIGLWGSGAAADPVTGQLYLAGGYDGSFERANVWRFDPATGRWATQPSMVYARFEPQAAFINGKLYVTGGINQQGSSPVPQTEIYDPASGLWSAGAPVPHTYYGAATAVLDGKMYVVGGCDVIAGCGESNVQVYNPATDHWSTAASYPVPVGLLGCGAIAGKLYCAGGLSDMTGFSTTAAGYVYDPATNAWSPIAAMPADLWGSGYGAADGQLLMSGGITAGGTVLTNQGYAYDPASNTWSPLPNAPFASYESASACGFYLMGGNTNPYGSAPTATAAQLPGYGGCGGQAWLSASPGTTTIAPGQSATITVTLAAVAPSVTQPGTYAAVLRAGNDDPYPAPAVPVTLTVTPPRTWGEITGTVYGKSCTGSTAPLPGAAVQVNGRHGTWPLTSDRTGRYGLWLDAGNDPLTVITSLPGWQSQAATVMIHAGKTTTHDVTLIPTSCG